MKQLNQPQILDNAIDEHGETLSAHLKSLAAQDKLDILDSLRKNDYTKINSMLDQINFPVPMSSNNHSTFKIYIILSMYESHSIPSTNIQVKQAVIRVLQSIPDYLIDLRSKYNVLNDVLTKNNAVEPEELSLAYDIKTPALLLPKDNTPSKLPLTKLLNQYTASIDQFVEKSDFIMLTTGLLANLIAGVPNQSLKMRLLDKLSLLQQQYFALDYNNCRLTINHISTILKDFDRKTYAAACERIDAGSYLFLDAVDGRREKNYTRRFYESVLSQYLVGSLLTTDNLRSISKIVEFYGRPALTAENFEPLISEVAHLSLPDPIENEKLFKNFDYLQSISPQYAQRDRNMRQHFRKRREEVFYGPGASTYSSNSGVMRNMQPNFRSDSDQPAARNRKADLYTPKRRVDERTKRATYVTALSGHTHFIVALLDKYIEANMHDPNLAEDVNNFIQAYLAVYVKTGYHGFHEMIDVFQEPAVKEVFAKFNIKIDTTPSTEVLAAAMQATAPYTGLLRQTQNLHAELLERFKSTEQEKPAR